MYKELPISGIATGIITASLPGTRAMVYARTHELALIAGRDSHEIKQVDYERAKREVTGETDFDLQEAILNSLALPTAH